jgi:hypothetical protein
VKSDRHAFNCEGDGLYISVARSNPTWLKERRALDALIKAFLAEEADDPFNCSSIQ